MIKRTQFTAHDGTLHPEIMLNDEYLELETISTHISKNVIISYGYMETNPDGSYKWIKIAEALTRM